MDEILDLDVRPPRQEVPKVRWVERSVTEDLRDVFTADGKIDLAMHLARPLVPIQEIAVRQAIPQRYLERRLLARPRRALGGDRRRGDRGRGPLDAGRSGGSHHGASRIHPAHVSHLE